MKFRIPGKSGEYSIQDVVNDYLEREKIYGKGNLKVIIATDGKQFSDKYRFGSAIIIYAKTKGGRVYRKSKWVNMKEVSNIVVKMLRETQISLDIATEFATLLGEEIDLDVQTIKSSTQIHLDINEDPNAGSYPALKAAVGYVVGMGFDVRTKPNAFGASSAADRCAIGKF